MRLTIVFVVLPEYTPTVQHIHTAQLNGGRLYGTIKHYVIFSLHSSFNWDNSRLKVNKVQACNIIPSLRTAKLHSSLERKAKIFFLLVFYNRNNGADKIPNTNTQKKLTSCWNKQKFATIIILNLLQLSSFIRNSNLISNYCNN